MKKIISLAVLAFLYSNISFATLVYFAPDKYHADHVVYFAPTSMEAMKTVSFVDYSMQSGDCRLMSVDNPFIADVRLFVVDNPYEATLILHDSKQPMISSHGCSKVFKGLTKR